MAFSAQLLFNAKASQDESGYDYCEIVNVYKGYKRDFEIIKGALYSVVPSTMLIIFSSLIITKLYAAKGQSMGKIAKQGNVMLLLVTFAFIVVILPVSTYFIIADNVYTDNYIAFVVTTNVYYTNHAINAFIYLLSGSKYMSCISKTACFLVNCASLFPPVWTE